MNEVLYTRIDDNNLEKIRQLPDEWLMIKLKEIAHIKYGKSNPKIEGHIPVYGSGGVYAYTSEPLVTYPSIVVGRKGNAGKAWLVTEPFWPSDTTFYCEWKEKHVNYQYLYFYMLFNPFSGEHAKTTLPSLQKPDIENCLIPYPPHKEQKNITYILSTIQQAIEATDKVINAAQELKKSLMQHLFTYGPVSLEKAENVQLKETEVGMVPEHWKFAKLTDLILEHYSGGTPSTANPGYWSYGTISWTTSAYIEGLYLNAAPKKISELGFKNSSTKIVPKNNILVGTRVGVGKIAINKIDVAISQDLTGLIVDKDMVDLEYLAYAMLTDNIQNRFISQTRGTTIKGIPQKDVLQLPIYIPPTQGQKDIVRLLSMIDNKIVLEKEKKESLQSLFNSMLHNLMTGKLRVNDLDLELPEVAEQ